MPSEFSRRHSGAAQYQILEQELADIARDCRETACGGRDAAGRAREERPGDYIGKRRQRRNESNLVRTIVGPQWGKARRDGRVSGSPMIWPSRLTIA
jgi:hypothetical protein